MSVSDSAELKSLRADLAAAKRLLKRLEKEFHDRLKKAVGELDANSERDLVLHVAFSDLKDRQDAEVTAGRRMLITRYRTWADKYMSTLPETQQADVPWRSGGSMLTSRNLAMSNTKGAWREFTAEMSLSCGANVLVGPRIYFLLRRTEVSFGKLTRGDEISLARTNHPTCTSIRVMLFTTQCVCGKASSAVRSLTGSSALHIRCVIRPLWLTLDSSLTS